MRQPIPVGTIPTPPVLTQEDEQYGHDVLSQLTEQFPLDENDARIERARRIVDRLTSAIGANRDPWHVYVLSSPDVKNAAATRGNHVFIWSGMLDSLPNDDELSVVVAHEVAHVLAEHARQSEGEQTAELLSQVVGAVAQNAIIYNGGIDVVANLAASLTQETVGGLIVNPESQRKELEADLIGMHLMAEAGIDPRIALAFWTKNLNNPDFDSGLPQFFSSHPSSSERLKAIRQNLEGAIRRYERRSGGGQTTQFQENPSRPRQVNSLKPTTRLNNGASSLEEWVVAEEPTFIHQDMSAMSPKVKKLVKGEKVSVVGRSGRWLRVTEPSDGYIWGPKLAPLF